MRRGEVLGLRWKNVDLDRASLRVVESVEQTKAGLRFKAPKTEQARAVTLPAFAVDELRRLKRQQAETLFRLGVRQTGENAGVLPRGWQGVAADQPHLSVHLSNGTVT
jgi:integrase